MYVGFRVRIQPNSAGYALCNAIKSGAIRCNSPRPIIPIPNEERRVWPNFHFFKKGYEFWPISRILKKRWKCALQTAASKPHGGAPHQNRCYRQYDRHYRNHHKFDLVQRNSIDSQHARRGTSFKLYGKQNDTATLQSTDTLLLKRYPTLNGTSCLPNPLCPIELQVPLGYTDLYLALSREPCGLPDLVPTHSVSGCKIIVVFFSFQTFWLCKPCRNWKFP